MDKTYPSGLMWFRRDLRSDDNAALYHALKSCRRVHCAFVFDTAILDAGPGFSSYLWSNGATSASIQVTTPGPYHVTLTYGTGCTVSATSNLATVANPVVTLGPDETLCAGNSTVLNAEDRSRYLALAEKLETDQLTETEHQEFLKWVDKDEKLRNERLKFMIELAQMRNISLRELMQNLGIAPVFNG